MKPLLAVVLAYTAASLFHYSHNAEFLTAYPNLPVWLTRGEVYLAWLAVTSVGVVGLALTLTRARLAGLAIVGIYGLLGLDGLGHYAVASMSAHTLTMNASIWLEAATGMMVMAAAAHSATRPTRATPSIP
jgi:hypothetical protein